MAAENIDRFRAGTNILIEAETRDADGDLVTPDGGVSYTLTDPDDDTVVSNVAMTEASTGVWRGTWQSSGGSEVGFYQVEVKATDGSKVSIKQDKQAFELY